MNIVMRASRRPNPKAVALVVCDVEALENILARTAIRAPPRVDLSHRLRHPFLCMISEDQSGFLHEYFGFADVNVPDDLDHLVKQTHNNQPVEFEVSTFFCVNVSYLAMKNILICIRLVAYSTCCLAEMLMHSWNT